MRKLKKDLISKNSKAKRILSIFMIYVLMIWQISNRWFKSNWRIGQKARTEKLQQTCKAIIRGANLCTGEEEEKQGRKVGGARGSRRK